MKNDIPEITLEKAKEDYTVYPQVRLIDTNKRLDLLTYVITESKYLVPVRMTLPKREYNILDIMSFVSNFERKSIQLKADYEGLDFFKGKPNYIYSDGLVVSIRKIVND